MTAAPLVVADDERYVRYFADGWNLDGVLWHKADPPPLFHRHVAHSVWFDLHRRENWACPCGARRQPDGPWFMRDWGRTGPRRWKGLR